MESTLTEINPEQFFNATVQQVANAIAPVLNDLARRLNNIEVKQDLQREFNEVTEMHSYGIITREEARILLGVEGTLQALPEKAAQPSEIEAAE